MRLSADPRSPYYREEMIHPVARVDHGEVKIRYEPVAIFVNGIHETACREACEEEGWADIYLFDKNGRHILDVAMLTPTPTVERLRGKVEVRRLPPPSAAERQGLARAAVQRMLAGMTVQ